MGQLGENCLPYIARKKARMNRGHLILVQTCSRPVRRQSFAISMMVYNKIMKKMETDQIFSFHCASSTLLAQIFLNPERGRITPSANGLKSTRTILKICQINSSETLKGLTIITFGFQPTGK